MAATFEILRIEVAAEEYGVRRENIQSVQLGMRVRGVSDGEDGRVGILRTTEGELPVYRLSDKLGMDADFPIEIQRVLVLRSEHGLWCLLVDRVSQAEVVSAEKVTTLPNVARAAYVNSVYSNEPDVLLLLDVKQLHPLAEPLVDSADLPLDPSSNAESQTTASRGSGRGHLLLFDPIGLNGDHEGMVIGLTPKQVDEVLRSAVIQEVPAAPEFLHGVTNWRGRLIPVLDLAARLGFKAERSYPRKQDRLVIARGMSGSPIAFYVKPNVDIVNLPAPHAPTDIPAEADDRLVRGAALYQGGRTVLVPQLNRLA